MRLAPARHLAAHLQLEGDSAALRVAAQPAAPALLHAVDRTAQLALGRRAARSSEARASPLPSRSRPTYSPWCSGARATAGRRHGSAAARPSRTAEPPPWPARRRRSPRRRRSAPAGRPRRRRPSTGRSLASASRSADRPLAGSARASSMAARRSCSASGPRRDRRCPRPTARSHRELVLAPVEAAAADRGRVTARLALGDCLQLGADRARGGGPPQDADRASQLRAGGRPHATAMGRDAVQQDVPTGVATPAIGFRVQQIRALKGGIRQPRDRHERVGLRNEQLLAWTPFRDRSSQGCARRACARDDRSPSRQRSSPPGKTARQGATAPPGLAVFARSLPCRANRAGFPAYAAKVATEIRLKPLCDPCHTA